MLKTRVITGAILSVIIATVLIFSHIPWVLNIAIALLSVQAIYELYRAIGLKNRVIFALSSVLAVFIALVEIPGYEYITLISFLAAIIIFVYFFINVRTADRIEPVLFVSLAVMIPLFFGSMSYIRNLEKGICILGGAVIISVVTDIMAYFVGKGCGKHKLAPIISPKKTIEGSIGGTFYGAAIYALIAAILQYCGVLSIVDAKTLIFYAILASVIGQFGDLALSSIKRIVGIKDYGKLLPGHGGILDRFDSMLFVMPFTYLFCTLCGTMIY